MSFVAFVEVLKLIGSLAAALTTIIAFIVLVSKKPREWFKKTIREEADNANQEVK